MAKAGSVCTMNKQAINIGIPTLHCYDKLASLCFHLSDFAEVSTQVRMTIIDNGGRLKSHSAWPKLKELPTLVDVLVPKSNLGVAASWNVLINKLGVCFICSDDVWFSAADMQAFLSAAYSSPETIIFNAANPGDHWGLFFMNKPKEWMQMGGFDEQFFPAYFEDNDAFWRLQLANLPCKFVPLQDFRHDRSSTLRQGDSLYQQKHWESFSKNAAYYQEKWGGLPGGEIFRSPFGGGS